MSKEQLMHIFDSSACLTKRQLKDYVRNGMTNEETHAIEVHLNSCPFCSEAVEGLFGKEEGRTALAEVNGDFIHEHFSFINPQIHLNSLASAHPVQQHVHRYRRKKAQPMWRTSSIAAVLLVGVAVVWYMESGKNLLQRNITQVASKETVTDSNTESQALAAQPVVDVQKHSELVSAGKPLPDAQNDTKNGNNGPQPLLYVAQTDDIKDQGVAEEAPVAKQEVLKQMSSDDEVQAAASNTSFAAEYKPKIDSHKEIKLEKTPMIASVPPSQDKLEMGDAFYKQGKYDIALAAYTQEMKSPDAERNAKASIKAAECYLAIGKTNKAKKILTKLADSDGPQKKAAQKMLDNLAN
jgi:hypothetical protein